MATAAGAWPARVPSVENKMAGTPIVVVDLRTHPFELGAELQAVASLGPVRFVVELESIAREPRLEVVADIEVPLRLNLRDRSHSRQVRQSPAEILNRRRVFVRLPR